MYLKKTGKKEIEVAGMEGLVKKKSTNKIRLER